MFLTMDLQDESTPVAAEQQLPAEPQTPAKTPMPRKKKMILIASACAVFAVVAAVALILIFTEAANSAKYERAVALMDACDLLQAKEEFLGISGYRDSADKAQECQNKYDFDSADTMLRMGDYAAARAAFAALGDYSNSHEKVNECDYDIALDLFKDGEPDKAKAAFLALGDYSDSAKQADICDKELDYIAAADKLTSGAYQAAYDAFNKIKDYRDAEYQAKVCKRYLDYAVAEQLLKDGKFYAAYKAFGALGTFEDSSTRMTECVQTTPIPGEIYRNPKYKKKSRALIIKSPKDEYIRCFKVYKGDVLISTILVSGGKKVTVKLPVGTYTIKFGVGKNWFGMDDLFGDEGYYCVYDKKYAFGKYYWTFDLTGSVKGDYIESTELDLGDF